MLGSCKLPLVAPVGPLPEQQSVPETHTHHSSVHAEQSLGAWQAGRAVQATCARQLGQACLHLPPSPHEHFAASSSKYESPPLLPHAPDTVQVGAWLHAVAAYLFLPPPDLQQSTLIQPLYVVNTESTICCCEPCKCPKFGGESSDSCIRCQGPGFGANSTGVWPCRGIAYRLVLGCCSGGCSG